MISDILKFPKKLYSPSESIDLNLKAEGTKQEVKGLGGGITLHFESKALSDCCDIHIVSHCNHHRRLVEAKDLKMSRHKDLFDGRLCYVCAQPIGC